ncbi:unnamed protein product, partial [Brenthis ino]
MLPERIVRNGSLACLPTRKEYLKNGKWKYREMRAARRTPLAGENCEIQSPTPLPNTIYLCNCPNNYFLIKMVH